MKVNLFAYLAHLDAVKTTLLRVIAGLETQSDGTISQNNKDISLLPPDQRDFGIVFSILCSIPKLKCKKIILPLD